jgi:hypothetical protein
MKTIRKWIERKREREAEAHELAEVNGIAMQNSFNRHEHDMRPIVSPHRDYKVWNCTGCGTGYSRRGNNIGSIFYTFESK